jgi:hypothetical protein
MKITHTKNLLLGALFTLLLSATCNAQNINGRWVLEKSVSYKNTKKVSTSSDNHTIITISNGKISNNLACAYATKKETYYSPSDPFQMLMKTGESSEKIIDFFKNQLSFDLNTIKYYYDISATPKDCDMFFANTIIASPEKLILDSNNVFYSYTRLVDTTKSSRYKLSTTALPFNIKYFEEKCLLEQEHHDGGIPYENKNCPTQYQTHDMVRKPKNELSLLIGHYNYKKLPEFKNRNWNDSKNRPWDGYIDPIKETQNPIYLVFPSKNEVETVAVFDIDQVERASMPPMLLTIKNNKVISQFDMNHAVKITEDYQIITQYKGKKQSYVIEDDGKITLLKNSK